MTFVGLTPVDEAKTNPISWKKSHAYKADLISQFSDVIREVCTERKIEFVDLLGVLGDNFLEKLKDGVHPDSAGHEEMYGIIRKHVI